MKRSNSLTVLLPFKGENSYIFEAISSIFYTDTLEIKLILIYHDENSEFLEKLNALIEINQRSKAGGKRKLKRTLRNPTKNRKSRRKRAPRNY